MLIPTIQGLNGPPMILRSPPRHLVIKHLYATRWRPFRRRAFIIGLKCLNCSSAFYYSWALISKVIVLDIKCPQKTRMLFVPYAHTLGTVCPSPVELS